MNARYALRTNAIADCRTMWSTGRYWNAEIPSKLLTGEQVDKLAARHPQAEIIDVVVYRAAAAIWMEAFRKATVPNSTHEQREAARAKAREAVALAGYRPI